MLQSITSFKLILGFLFVMLVAAIAVLVITSYYYSNTTNETARMVKHTHEVLDQTEELSSLYKDIQLESTAFFISTDSSIMVPYLSACRAIFPQVGRLKNLTADNPFQLLRIDTLVMLLQQLKTFTDSALIYSQGQFSRAQIERRIDVNRRFRSGIRRVIAEIKQNEIVLLATREAANEKSIADFKRTFFLLSSGIGVLLVTTFLSIRYNFNRRVRAQEALKSANAFFVKLFYESPIGIVITRLDTGVIIDCNKAYSELTGYGKTELIGRTAVELGILQNISQRNEIIGQVRNAVTLRDLEVQLKPKNGDAIWVSVSIQSIKIDNEMCLLNAVLDMTVHKQAQEKIKQALAAEIALNELKSNFVSLASHEFRTPLTTILSSAFLLENYSFGENKEKVSKHVSRIKGSVNLLTSILDEFLSLTKIEEGKVVPKSEKINLKETLENLCHNFRPFSRPGQDITFHHSGDQEIYSDPVLLGNIVNNLISNAIKYSPENSEIHVSSLVNSKVKVVVRDAGIGIPKPDQEHLFERFFRASNAGNTQGTGLGLHIMKHYVDLLHGVIEVKSEPGKGSEFSITLAKGELVGE